MSSSAPQRSTALAASSWEAQVRRKLDDRERIADAFDRAEAYQLMGDVELALAWLDTAAALSGGLSPEAAAQRACWAREVAERRGAGSEQEPA